MDTLLKGSCDEGLLRDWAETVRAAANRHGISSNAVPVRGWLGGAMLVACVRMLGGTVEPDEPFYGWILRDQDEDQLAHLEDSAPELKFGTTRIGDFHGLVIISLDGERFVALRTDEPVACSTVVRTLVLAGPSLEATMRLAERLAAARQTILRRERTHVFGAPPKLFVTSEVAEADLILPADFKRDLLAFLDGFSRAADVCRRLRISPSRGALFVGAPGTGKTQAVRHLLGRLQGLHQFVFTIKTDGQQNYAARMFEAMLDQVAEFAEPSVIVIEDIDKIFEVKALTPQFFLNVVDGLFQPQAPVMLIATSNDPRGFEANLLDRPGRFDRIFVFPLPGPVERRQLFERFASWPLDSRVVEELAQDSDGLTGAHVREVCYAAALDTAEEPVRFADALRDQLEKVREQHGRARRYDLELNARKMGFGS